MRGQRPRDKYFALAFTSLVLCGSIACGNATSVVSPVATPRFARVSIVSATIGLGKVDGSDWDGPGHVPPELGAGLALALETPGPYASVVGFLATAAVDGLKAPDPFGRATIDLGDGRGFDGEAALNRAGKTHQDTYTPSWDPPATWTHVPITDRMRIRVHIEDEDITAHDDIGTAEINARDIEQALAAGNVLQVNVAAQTQNQLLFVGVSAIAE